MCGRINVSDHPGVQILMDFLEMPFTDTLLSDKQLSETLFTPRFNITPTSNLLVFYADNKLVNCANMQWGLTPQWQNNGSYNAPLINARAESIWHKPSFKELVKSRRIVIPVTGFYEWKKNQSKQSAFYIQSSEKSALAFAGIYSHNSDGNPQCCIITTAANDAMSDVHHRMPVILPSNMQKEWLLSTDQSNISSMMTPCENQAIEMYEVSNYVNSSKNQGKKCSERDTNYD